MIQIKTKYVAVLALLITVGIYVLGYRIGHSRANTQSVAVITALTGEVKQYQYKYDSVVKYASERDQLVIEQKVAIESGLIDKAELKKLHLKAVSEVTKLKAQVEVLLDSVSHNGTVVVVQPCPPEIGEEHPVLYLPFEFKKKDKFLDLKGEFDEKGEMSLSLKVPVALDLWTGYNRQEKKYTATVTSDNKLFQVTEIRSIKVASVKPKKFGIGVQVGYGINFKDEIKAQPYIGVGASYNLIRF